MDTAKDTPAKFVRLSSYHAANEVCVNSLRQIRSAIWLCAEDSHLADRDAIGRGYLGLDNYLIDGKWLVCPSAPAGWTDTYTTAAVVDRPACAIVPSSHILEDP